MTFQGRPITLPRLQARALFFRLAAAKGPVSREELTELFWSDHPPAAARRNLTRLLSYLRSQLPRPDWVQVGTTSVSIPHERVKTDVDRFTELCNTGEPADWERAVSMYRGPFLAGFVMKTSPEFDHWLTGEQRRLERLYLEALDRLVTANLHRPAAAIRYAQQYLATDELAEDIHRSLITLFAANGNRTAALQQYEICVKVLERELGVSPLPETRAAYETARQGRRTAARPPPPKPDWTVLPSLDLPLVGREESLAALESACGRQRLGGMILISGEAGVGKTRLMQEFAIRDSRAVLSGNNHPSTQSLSYHPLVQALRQAIPHPHLWTGIPPLWLGELAPLLPEIGDHFPDLPPPISVEPQQAQARLREALTRAFLGITGHPAPLLLCLDDLHWADEATLSWLSDLSRRLADSRV
ncbi:MAG TPA: AAA family ATPase, partial [Anaerolineales bacterium]|nr:AAA family ATPase [Anaerolineales bacterium]